MSGETTPPRSDAGEAKGDKSLRNFFGGLLLVSAIVIAVMIVVEQTAG
jgi:hypothetical protein